MRILLQPSPFPTSKEMEKELGKKKGKDKAGETSCPNSISSLLYGIHWEKIGDKHKMRDQSK